MFSGALSRKSRNGII